MKIFQRLLIQNDPSTAFTRFTVYEKNFTKRVAAVPMAAPMCPEMKYGVIATVNERVYQPTKCSFEDTRTVRRFDVEDVSQIRHISKNVTSLAAFKTLQRSNPETKPSVYLWKVFLKYRFFTARA